MYLCEQNNNNNTHSPFPYAEGSMADIIDQLMKEEAGLVTDRGLEGAPEDIQSFEVFLTTSFVRKFHKLYGQVRPPLTFQSFLDSLVSQSSPLKEASMRQGRRGPRGGPRGGVEMASLERRKERRRRRKERRERKERDEGEDGKRSFHKEEDSDESEDEDEEVGTVYAPVHTTVSERLVQAWKDAESFLHDFIDEGFTKTTLTREVRERSFFQALLHAPPEMVTQTPNIFFPDDKNRFTSLWLSGIEWDLFVLNVLTHAVCDIWFGRTALSLLLTYLLDALVRIVRKEVGRFSIAKRSLIDERFLH